MNLRTEIPLRQLLFSTLVLLIVLFQGLTKKTFSQSNSDGQQTQIHFDAIVGNEIKCALSAIVKEIEYIPLETNQECLVGKIRSWSLSDDFVILITNNKIFKFSRTGKFIQKIGNRGHGPGEYVDPMDFAIDPMGKLFVLDRGIRRILSYTTDGDYIDKILIPAKGHPWQLYYRANSLLLVNQILPPIEAQLLQIDLKTDDIYSYKIMSGLMNSSLYPGGLDYVSIYNSESSFLYTSAWNDTIFRIQNQKLDVEYTVDYGKYKYPLAKKRGSLNNEGMIREKVYQYWKAIKDNYIFFQYDYKQTFSLAIYDRMSNKFIFNGGEENSMINDIDGGFGLMHIANSNRAIGNCMAVISSAIDFKTQELGNDYRSPGDREKLTTVIESIDEEDNPVIQILHLK